MGLASNEAKEQRILLLKKWFNNQEVITLQSAVKKTGYTEATIRKWAIQGDIPLWDTAKKTSIVPINSKNKPSWMA